MFWCHDQDLVCGAPSVPDLVGTGWDQLGMAAPLLHNTSVVPVAQGGCTVTPTPSQIISYNPLSPGEPEVPVRGELDVEVFTNKHVH